MVLDAMMKFIFYMSMLYATCAFGFQGSESACVLPDLGKDEAINIIIKNKFAEREMIKDVRIWQHDCRYFVMIDYAPDRPGSFFVFEISQDKKIVKAMAGH